MEKIQNILKLRERFDQTLALPDFVSESSIKALINNQLLRSSFCEVEGDVGDVVQRRTIEVLNFLQMLRSSSGNESEIPKTQRTSKNDWKLKQDNDQHRIMYREGPQGTPFHTLLIDGYVDGPIDICLCVGWETTLFKKWWPQFSVPPFKIILSTCLKKVRIGEEISLVRVKVPWPMTTREAVLHNFVLEYFQEDLIVVLINSVSDKEHIEMRTHGFSRDGIPEARDIVRVDLVGGFALQKVSSNRTYFRTILNLDMKIEFVPPTLINFISRQLLGSGFKLYKKIVASAASGDEDFIKALEGPMYVRVREDNKGKEMEAVDNEKSKGVLGEEYAVEAAGAHKPVMNHAFFSEIEEDVTEPAIHLVGDRHMNDSSTSQFSEVSLDDNLIESLYTNQELLHLEGVSNAGKESRQHG